MTQIIRISNYNPVLANTNKHNLLLKPFDKYKLELQRIVDILLYTNECIPQFLPTEFTKQIKFKSWLSQVLAKQASAIVRSIHSKIDKANSTPNEFQSKYQKEILNKYNSEELKIDILNINIELDSRFIDIQENKTTTICDYWIKIQGFDHKKFYIPLNLTNHMKNLISRRGFTLKTNSLRINNNSTIGLYFYKEQKKKNTDTSKSIGIDIGRNKLIACSCNKVETTHSTGNKIKQLLEQIKVRKQNSKQFNKTRTEIRNQINYSLKHCIDWKNTTHIYIEKLKNIKHSKKWGPHWGKKNQFWLVGYTINKIKQLSQENDVRLTEVNAANTSIICSNCRCIDKGSRSKEEFLCIHCGFSCDADINAAINIHNRGVNSISVKKIYNHI
jgi:transposase